MIVDEADQHHYFLASFALEKAGRVNWIGELFRHAAFGSIGDLMVLPSKRGSLLACAGVVQGTRVIFDPLPDKRIVPLKSMFLGFFDNPGVPGRCRFLDHNNSC